MMKSIRRGDRVLITGGTGSLGRALVARLLPAGAVVRVFSRDEKKQLDMRRALPGLEYCLGDVRDPAAARDAVRDVDLVIHGASLKYVDVSEIQPAEYVSTNVAGTMNMLNAALDEPSVRRFVGVSSDKACQPVNTYGLTKALLEKLTLEANRRQGSGTAVFTAARYGNVIGTRGSVVPLWRDRLAQGLSLTVTDPEMTRFFFTMDEAIELIDKAFQLDAGQVISKRMNACTVGDLAAVMGAGAPVEVVGMRPGEKKHELLLTGEEMRRSHVDGSFFVMDPTWSDGEPVAYSSDVAPRLPHDDIARLLERTEL